MESADKSTEQIILKAARLVFLDKGFDGARMQEIADKAGINKALLHYYFRSKEKLFMAIFTEAIGKLIPRIITASKNEINFREFLNIFVSSYHEIMMENPFLPLFVVREIHRMPEAILEMMKQKGFDPKMVKGLIQNQIDKGNIRPVDPVQLISSLVGLSLFPFIGMPIIKSVLLENESEWERFLEERKEFIVEFTLKGLDYEKNK